MGILIVSLLQMIWWFTDIDTVFSEGSSQIVHSQSLFLLKIINNEERKKERRLETV